MKSLTLAALAALIGPWLARSAPVESAQLVVPTITAMTATWVIPEISKTIVTTVTFDHEGGKEWNPRPFTTDSEGHKVPLGLAAPTPTTTTDGLRESLIWGANGPQHTHSGTPEDAEWW